MVGSEGLEPSTKRLRVSCSTNWATNPCYALLYFFTSLLLGSPWWIRTTVWNIQSVLPYRLANGLYIFLFLQHFCLVGPERFELSTKRLKVSCSTDWATNPFCITASSTSNLAAYEGFEPPSGTVKVSCLTAWLIGCIVSSASTTFLGGSGEVRTLGQLVKSQLLYRWATDPLHCLHLYIFTSILAAHDGFEPPCGTFKVSCLTAWRMG